LRVFFEQHVAHLRARNRSTVTAIGRAHMSALRIFAHVPSRRSLVRPGRVMPIVVVPPPEPETDIAPLDPAIERRIINILESAPQFGETIDAAYRRKERALAEAFAILSRNDAANLQRRLDQPRADDDLAQRFARLVVDRRTRLLAVLADIPRRRAR
jgi:hypothetical protein